MMHLADLHPGFKGDTTITGLTADSRKVQPGFLFAALPGEKTDGRLFIEDVIKNGAAAVLAPEGLVRTAGAQDIVLLTHDNPRREFARMCARFYGAQPETITAVTGTNGKTSTVWFTEQLWKALDQKAESIGTLSGALTTPDPATLHAGLAEKANAGITHLAIEASSHGLDQYRLDGLKIKSAGFTNLSRDHLDYHEDMDDYLSAKARLFTDLLEPNGAAILNTDVPEFAYLQEQIQKRKDVRPLHYGRNEKANLRLLSCNISEKEQNIDLKIENKNYKLILPFPATFQVMNALCALGLVISNFQNDADRIEQAVRALESLDMPPGRLQPVTGHPKGAKIYVDYAHTPDALDNILTALRPQTTGRLFCIAGCGGDRDPGKRPIMGGIASEKSDIAIITDDNPRTEDPATIRAAVMDGAGPNAREIGGRRAAIVQAISELQEGDVLVIAGKGHEQGQIIGETVEPFDDADEARKAIAAL